MAIRKIIKRATDALFTNTEFDGTEATRMVKGTTGQRASAEAGDLRFNTTTSLLEYYDGTQWKSIDAPPVISSINPTNIADTSGSTDIVISGSNFSTSPTVIAIGQDGSEITPDTVVRDSATQITATFDGTDFSDAQEDYDIKVTNTSGLSITLADALAVNASPVWTVASGSLGVFYDTGTPSRTGISITTGATDDEGASLTYSLASGDSLPAGLSLNSSTGAITGDADAVGSDTTTNFDLEVTDGANTVTRSYSIEIKAPVITEYTSVTSGSFSVPSGITAVDVLVVAGGGGGGGSSSNSAAGGGGGGLIYRPAFPVTPGGSVSYTVGGGGDAPPSSGIYGQNGQNSVFGGLTAIGGGGGGSQSVTNPQNGNREGAGTPGGSGGGSSFASPDGQSSTGVGTQPQQPGDSGTYGFGNPGGTHTATMGNAAATGGGGAGAKSADNDQNANTATAGGIGKQYDISGSQVYYAGGGGSDGYAQHTQGGQGGGGQAGYPNGPDPAGTAVGTANRGGGGAGNATGGPAGGPAQGGDGGSGIVIVKY